MSNFLIGLLVGAISAPIVMYISVKRGWLKIL